MGVEDVSAVGLDDLVPKRPPAVAVAAGTPAAPSRYAADVWLPVALKWFAVILLSAGIAVAAVFGYQRRMARTAATGSVTVETAPVGLPVSMGGKSLGITPLTTVLAPGAYELQVGTAPNLRTIKVNVTAGTPSCNGWNSPTRCRPSARTLEGCVCRPSLTHLPVLVDGQPHGLSPVALDNLEPGDHEIAVRTSGGFVKGRCRFSPAKRSR